jgi:Asp-tRNA(Asn)/Glu-tRNA(Gln) amidotransferase A subunit family amidase
MSLCYSLDKLGPICRTVGDTSLVLASIHGGDARDPSSVSEPFNYDLAQSCEGLRIGWHPSWFAGATNAEHAVLKHLKNAGCDLVEVELPDLPFSTLLIPLFAEAAASFENLTRSNRDDELSWQAPEAWPNTFRKSWFIPAVELVQADRVRRQAMNAMADMFESVDALAAPSFAANLLLITNATGHPALVQPIAIQGGQPHGFTLIGRLFDEGTICRLGNVLERSFNVVDQHPEAR